jgi:predicted HicB family RNase H-like nuclease
MSAQQQQHKHPSTYPAKLTIVTTASMAAAIATAAKTYGRSMNAYIRGAVFERLRADGVELRSE